MCVYLILFKRVSCTLNELFMQTIRAELHVVHGDHSTVHVHTHAHCTFYILICELSRPYTVMQYMQHLQCHPVWFPHLFLSDRTMTNARKMAGNILSMEEAIFYGPRNNTV